MLLKNSTLSFKANKLKIRTFTVNPNLNKLFSPLVSPLVGKYEPKNL